MARMTGRREADMIRNQLHPTDADIARGIIDEARTILGGQFGMSIINLAQQRMVEIKRLEAVRVAAEAVYTAWCRGVQPTRMDRELHELRNALAQSNYVMDDEQPTIDDNEEYMPPL